MSPAPLVDAGRIALALSVGAPALGALCDSALRRRDPQSRLWSVIASDLAATSAVVLCIVTAVQGPVELSLRLPGRLVVIGLVAGHLNVTLLALVGVIGAVVQRYATRYLSTDGGARRFAIAASLLLSGMALVSSSSGLLGLVVGWILAGRAFVAALGCRAQLPGVADAKRRATRAFLVGDAALLAAAALLVMRTGDGAVPTPVALNLLPLRLGGATAPIAFLVVVAALARCAQAPFSRWLLHSVAAPTPVSALAHAGLVNGGGILLVRLSTVLAGSRPAMAFAFALALSSAVGATSVMSRRADVKSRLVCSTVAQMGFMLAEIAVGVPVAALVHLVGHAIYKATLFLGSGGPIVRPGRLHLPETAPRRALQVTTSASAGALAATVVGLISPLPADRGGAVLVVFVAAAAAAGAWSWRSSIGTGLLLGPLALLGLASAAYGALSGGLATWLASSVVAPRSALDPALLLGVVIGAALVELLRRAPRTSHRLDALLVDLGSARERATHSRLANDRPSRLPVAERLGRLRAEVA